MSTEIVPTTPLDVTAPDPYGWLEEVEAPEALAWAMERSAETAVALGNLDDLTTDLARVLDSDERIATVELIDGRYYNFWTDAAHPRGLWRRTTPESYVSAVPEWETLLDLDALSTETGVGYVWHGASIQREPVNGVPYARALLALAPGGNDADVTREFDMLTLRFVPPEEGGFERAQAKGGLTWAGPDAVFVATDFGAGTTSTSGYPLVVKHWRRGTALTEAVTVYEGESDDMLVSAVRLTDPGHERDVVTRRTGFYSGHTYLLDGVGTDRQTLIRIEVPETAEVGFHGPWLTLTLRDEWTVDGRTYAAGSLLVIDAAAFLGGERKFEVAFAPSGAVSLETHVWSANHLVLNLLDDVKSRLQVLTPPSATAATGEWVPTDLSIGETDVSVQVSAVDSHDSDDLWVVTTGFLTAATLIRISATGGTPSVCKATAALFDTTGLSVEQRFVTSADGTRVPYWLVGRPEQLSGELGPQPTLLWGYGGFEVAVPSAYNPVIGTAWLERGGVYAAACIRGGGEYGPAWHQSALRENRHRCYEDFTAIAKALVAAGITDRAHLGAQGRSNGGLLMGMMYTRYPELFGAIV
ncbi:MAG: prolyl oligopeptidase family serine peptidase, partial [Propionibacteriaceae bacterium]|nr:prolyl oligopeptidase family serine peptidase [Propionibacteriaceae bacterium]